MKIKYVYLYSLVAAFFKIVPIVSTFMIGIIGAIQMYLNRSRPLMCIAEMVIYVIVDYKLSTYI